MSDTLLEDIEADIFGLLSAVPDLSLAKVIRSDEGLTDADIAQSLVTITGATKIGLGLVILPAEVVSAERNLPGTAVRVQASVQVIEAVLMNRDATNGTQIKASIAAMRVLGALHQQRIGNRVLYAERNPIEPLPMTQGFVSYAVNLFSESNGGDSTGKVRDLEFALDGDGDLLITTATAGAAIYYTTDGSFPGPSNPDADLYAGPVNIIDDLTIRAAAYLSPLNPSDISEITVNISGATVTLNGIEVTMGGEPILL